MAGSGPMTSAQGNAQLRTIAKRQKEVTVLFLLLVFGQVLSAVFIGFAVLLGVVLIVFVVRLMRAMDSRTGVIVLASIGMLVPIINCLVVLVVNLQACSVLQRAGLRVGFIGVADEELGRLDP